MSINRTGPIDLIETRIFSHIIHALGGTYNDDTSDMEHNNDYHYVMCPPDKWIDPAFVVRDDGSSSVKSDDVNEEDSLYSERFDPRNKVAMQTYFPHCALQRWVEPGDTMVRGKIGFKLCPDGEEYVSVIRAPTSQSYRHRHRHTNKIILNKSGGSNSNTDEVHQDDEEPDNRIPKILHISSPTNCLPTSTVQTLSRFVESAPVPRSQDQNPPQIHHHTIQHGKESSHLAIYIHSHQAMHNYLVTKEFIAFPEVKEGILCGMGKMEAASRKAVMELLGGEGGEDTVEDAAGRTRQQQIVDDIAFGVLRDIWRYLILWEYGGITMDFSTLHAILEGDDKYNHNENSVNLTTTANAESGDARLLKLMKQWWDEVKSDALLYFISNYFDNGDSIPTPRERTPLSNILGAAPRHPFMYSAAKSALRYAIWDGEISITNTGRRTQIPPIKDGLINVNSSWERIKTGGIVDVVGYDVARSNSIHLLNGNDALPSPLTSPERTSWRSIFAAFAATPPMIDNGDAGGRTRRSNSTDVVIDSDTTSIPSEAKIMEVMQRVASEQAYISIKSLFSCMAYRLDMYMQK